MMTRFNVGMSMGLVPAFPLWIFPLYQKSKALKGKGKMMAWTSVIIPIEVFEGLRLWEWWVVGVIFYSGISCGGYGNRAFSTASANRGHFNTNRHNPYDRKLSPYNTRHSSNIICTLEVSP